MLQRFFGPGYDYETFDVTKGELPPSPTACDAYIVSGSLAEADTDADWISALKDFLCQARGKAALVGICFGHQVMAEAFGGRVARSDKGWGIGLHTYAVTNRRPWMDDAGALCLAAAHQDQVVGLPPNATVIAGSYFCPIAAIEYDDCAAISFQAHPEFDPDFARALINTNKQARYAPAQAAVALSSLDLPNDNTRVKAWVRRFLEMAAVQDQLRLP